VATAGKLSILDQADISRAEFILSKVQPSILPGCCRVFSFFNAPPSLSCFSISFSKVIAPRGVGCAFFPSFFSSFWVGGGNVPDACFIFSD
jgi:hypothetical protein